MRLSTDDRLITPNAYASVTGTCANLATQTSFDTEVDMSAADEAKLLAKWEQLHSSDDSTDQERQEWFSDAAAHLQQAGHWWCQHSPLLTHFAEIFVYHTQPVVQRLWGCMAEQLSTCALCVVNYHAAQVRTPTPTCTQRILTVAVLALVDADSCCMVPRSSTNKLLRMTIWPKLCMSLIQAG